MSDTPKIESVEVGHYRILLEPCIETDPCTHYVINTETGKKEAMDGIHIYKMLHNAGILCPHFDHCASERYRVNPNKKKKAGCVIM
jgi:hypothetical protein